MDAAPTAAPVTAPRRIARCWRTPSCQATARSHHRPASMPGQAGWDQRRRAGPLRRTPRTQEAADEYAGGPHSVGSRDARAPCCPHQRVRFRGGSERIRLLSQGSARQCAEQGEKNRHPMHRRARGWLEVAERRPAQRHGAMHCSSELHSTSPAHGQRAVSAQPGVRRRAVSTRVASTLVMAPGVRRARPTGASPLAVLPP